MSYATDAQIRDRIVALLKLVTGMSATPEITTYDDPNIVITSAQLPGFFVGRIATGLHRLTAAHERTSIRNYTVTLVVAEFPDDNATAKAAAIAACEPFLDSVIDYLISKQQLQLPGTDNGLPGVRNITIRDDGESESVNRGGKRYSTIVVRIDVTKLKRV